MSRIQRANAKINLGLEILGRRADGYHEVRTILCTISLADRLEFEDAPEDTIVACGAGFDVAPHDNLVLSALGAMRARGVGIPPQQVTIDKTIPAAAGLGGASSDAAAAIRAFASEIESAGADPTSIAGSLGSDVPFFLDGAIALATGRGDALTPLPVPTLAWVVLVTPVLDIPEKTRTMYAAVDPDWWTDGSRVDAIADALPALPNGAPFNVFERGVLSRYPETSTIRERLLAAGAPYAALTGAGPTFYTLVDTENLAHEIAGRVAGGNETVIVARLGDDHA